MIGMHLLGGVGGLLSWMMRETDSEVTSSPSCSLRRLLTRISHHSMGAMTGGCCWSRMPLGFTVWLIMMVGVGGVGNLSLVL